MLLASASRRRATVVVIGWLLSAGVAVLVGLGAIDALGSGIVGPASPPLNASDVQQQLATLSATPAPLGSDSTSAPATSTPVTSAPSTDPAVTTPAADPATGGGEGSQPADSSNPSGSDGGSDSAPPAPPTSNPPSSSPPPPPPDDDGITKVTSTDGGTVISTCRSGLATIDSAAPAQGFVKENLERGPDQEVGVRFESDSRRVEVSVTCGGSGPVVEVDTD